MDSDPWADTPATPRTGTPRVSIEQATTNPLESTETARERDSESSSNELAVEGELRDASPSSPSADELAPPIERLHVDPPKSMNDAPQQVEAEGDADFDDFDDFDAPEAGPSRTSGDMGTFAEAATDGNDGFGDFGDFEEGDFDAPPPPEEVAAAPVAAQPAHSWKALNLRPFPTTSELLDQLSDILRPLVPPPGVLSDTPARNVGGLSQVMAAESSRDVYAQLTTAPMLKPLDWTRSRVRREHLISMGVPVNLDEVDSHRISSLPPLRITTQQHLNNNPVRRAQSMDLHNGNGSSRSSSDRPGSAISTRDKGKGIALGASSEEASGYNGDGDKDKGGKYGLGERPEMDTDKAEEMCGLEEDRLSLLSLASLREIQNELVETSSQASSTLAWALQLKDAQSQDSATYNGMISELIANAAKAKTAQQTGSGGVFRRSSTKVKQNSTSSTPRVGSPAMR